MPPRQACLLIRLLALALADAHAHGIVHRDLKPGNILINQRGEPIILDFGLALRTVPGELRATLPGTFMGTPPYMAPEQAVGDLESMGPCSDIYSLGVIFYELLAGRLPFTGSLHELIVQTATQDPPPLRALRPEIDPKLEAICHRAMARKKEARFASMADFAAAIDTWLSQTAEAEPASLPTPAAQPDPRFAAEALDLIRQWGWEKSLEMLRERLKQTTDPARQAELHLLIGWLAGERGRDQEALTQFRDSAVNQPLADWARIGEAFVALRQKKFSAAKKLLTETHAREPALRGALAHLRGTVAYHEGDYRQARRELQSALEILGPDHFATGRVLDTLGMVHAVRCQFFWALEAYKRALELKRKFGDDAGVSLAHGQLGRLHLNWNRLDQAEAHFRQGLDLARRIGDDRGEAQLHNHRAQVLLLQGKPAQAEAFLDESIRASTGVWPTIEGYARKDRAQAFLAQKKLELAEDEVRRAEELFVQAGFAEGSAHVAWVWGLVKREQGRPAEAVRFFRQAAGQFEQFHDPYLAGQAFLDLAQTLSLQGSSPVLIAEALEKALNLAEQSRRFHLVRRVEEKFLEVAPAELYRRRHVEVEPFEEQATILALELREISTDDDSPLAQARKRDDLCIDLTEILTEHRLEWSVQVGDIYLALSRGRDHVRQAAAARDDLLRCLAEFNAPRKLLHLPVWEGSVTLATGLIGWTKGKLVGGPVAKAIREGHG